MKIALAVEGTRGDVYPMLALARRLQLAGHEATVVAPPEFADVAAEKGVAFRAAGNNVRSYLTEHAAVLNGNGPAAVRAQSRFIRESIEMQLTTVPEAVRGSDLILGAGVQFAAASAAEQLGIPYRYVMYCPAMLPSAEHAPALFGAAGLPRFGNRLLWWVFRCVGLPLLRRGVNKAREDMGLGPVDDALRHLFSDRPLLAADAAIAPVPADSRIRPRSIAYLQDLESPPLSEKLEAFLDAGAKPVYFGFGSMTDASPAATTQALVEVAARTGLRAVISEGWAGLAGGALPENVISVGSVSHARLFPRVCAVVHHGGAGTTTAAARAGVPQLVVPHLLDQFYWRERVAKLGLGPPGPARRRLDVATLSEALIACGDNEVLTERARAVGDEIARSLDPEADVAAVLAPPGEDEAAWD